MRSTEILAIALGLFASAAYSAPTGTINGRGPQTDTQPAENAVNDAVNKLRPASTLKSRGPQLDARAPQDPISDAINRLRPASGRRSAQGPGAAFESIENALNPSGRRSAQGENRNENGIRPNVPQAQGPPSLKTRSPQTASNRNGPGQASSSDDDSS
ncbi:hypothetical protein HBI18_117280 [Parastagonospora nodorum]|nr:hypothetical protein HBI18_117280 [Parastagonospora nodorum]